MNPVIWGESHQSGDVFRSRDLRPAHKSKVDLSKPTYVVHLVTSSTSSTGQHGHLSNRIVHVARSSRSSHPCQQSQPVDLFDDQCTPLVLIQMSDRHRHPQPVVSTWPIPRTRCKDSPVDQSDEVQSQRTRFLRHRRIVSWAGHPFRPLHPHRHSQPHKNYPIYGAPHHPIYPGYSTVRTPVSIPIPLAAPVTAAATTRNRAQRESRRDRCQIARELIRRESKQSLTCSHGRGT